MAKRYRDFLRLNMTAKTARYVRAKVVDLTFNDHYKKCADEPDCHHIESGNLAVARAVEAGITIGSKRARLDLACPFAVSDYAAQVHLLECVASRIDEFSADAKGQVRAALKRLIEEIERFARRNAMEVIAEASLR